MRYQNFPQDLPTPPRDDVRSRERISAPSLRLCLGLSLDYPLRLPFARTAVTAHSIHIWMRTRLLIQHRFVFNPRSRPATLSLRRFYWARINVPMPMEVKLTEQEDELCTLLDECTRSMKESEGIETSCRIAGGWVRDKV